jgi:hypothetical protein
MNGCWPRALDNDVTIETSGIKIGTPPQAILQGVLEKKGQLFTSWRTRTFVLESNKMLSYYEVRNDRMFYKGCIPLNQDVQLIRGGVDKTGRAIIKICTFKRIMKRHFLYTTPGSTYVMGAPSKSIQDMWVTALRSALAVAKVRIHLLFVLF